MDSAPPRRGRGSRWLWAHAAVIALVLITQVSADRVEVSLPIPVVLALQLLWGLGVLLGAPWSLLGLVIVVPSGVGPLSSAVTTGTPMLVNLVIHVAVRSWVSARHRAGRVGPRA